MIFSVFVSAMSEAIQPLKPTPNLGLAWRLVWCSLASMLVFAVLFPNVDVAGGIRIGPIGFSVGMACAVVSSICFFKCPRRCYTSKLLTFLFLWPVLYFAVRIVVGVGGQWLAFHH